MKEAILLFEGIRIYKNDKEEKVSLSLIAKSCQVSLTTVIRTLKEFKSYLPK
ncbi:hypothetical protein GHH94_14815, partial [Enterococcus faecium]|nr:hypothetical protein [Enterococcus faecium]